MLFATLRGYCKMSSTYSAGLVRLVSLIGGLPGFGDVALAPVGPTAADLLQTLEIAVVLSRTTGLKHAGMPFNFETWLVSTIASTGPAFATVRRCADVCCCCLSSSNRGIGVLAARFLFLVLPIQQYCSDVIVCFCCLQACVEFLRLSAASKGGNPPVSVDAVRTIIAVIRSHQAMFADPLPYNIDTAIENCLVAFPGVGAASAGAGGRNSSPPGEPQEDLPSSGSDMPAGTAPAAEVRPRSLRVSRGSFVYPCALVGVPVRARVGVRCSHAGMRRRCVNSWAWRPSAVCRSRRRRTSTSSRSTRRSKALRTSSTC